MRIRLLVLAAIACYAASLQFSDEKQSRGHDSAVLGSAMSLSDVVSGTYDRREEGKGRKAKPQLAVNKTAKQKRNGQTRQASSRRPKTRDLASGYRTLCVRLCDGYYFPVSAAAVPAEFERDEATCQASCASPAMLFVYKNADGTPETMSSLDGKPYTSLATAFKHRVSYDASCTCAASPWTEASIERHKLYAVEEAAKKGDAAAEPQRQRLAAAVIETRRTARARTGADLVASRSAEVLAGAVRDRNDTVAVRKAAVRAPVVRGKVRETERQVIRQRQVATRARMTRAMRTTAHVRTSEMRVALRR